MANEQNLIPQAHELTVEEASKGGKRSGEARRRKKLMREAFEFVGEYESGVEAGKALRKTAHGFRWKYKGTEWRYVYDGR